MRLAPTQAPWKALPCVKRDGHTIYSEGGVVIANTGTHSAGAAEPANARLIAAAPELYEACRLFDAAANMSVFDDSADAALAKAADAAEAALAKARGQ